MPPADAPADELRDWRQHPDGQWRRAYQMSARTLTLASSRSVFVDVDGEQAEDGTVSRTITVEGADRLTSAEARQVARALMAAAEELDRAEAVDADG